MNEMPKDRYTTRLATTATDIAAVMALRAATFRKVSGAIDADDFDALCTQVMVEDTVSGALICTFRLFLLPNGSRIGQSYSAKFYDLGALRDYRGPMLEVGRFCVATGLCDPDILRVAWAFITRAVDAGGVGMLFGCSSFQGTDPSAHSIAFAVLGASHCAPRCLAPRPGSPNVHVFGNSAVGAATPPRHSPLALPPLLRTYLAMGGWVSDHAVIDHDLGTLHVFTAIEIAAIPPSRARRLRADAG